MIYVVSECFYTSFMSDTGHETEERATSSDKQSTPSPVREIFIKHEFYKQV